MTKKRARGLGLLFTGATGERNSILDVPGVLVGQTTLVCPGDPHHGQIRTGVTAILPRGFQERASPVLAGQFSLNGNGEMTGCHWISDAGYFLGPICVTNTYRVGVALHATVGWMIAHHAEAFRHEHIWAMPVIAET